MDQDIIRSVSIFSSLPDEEVERLAKTLNLKEIPQGTLLVEEDTPGVRYYILVDGEVEVVKALGTPDERSPYSSLNWIMPTWTHCCIASHDLPTE